MLDLLAGPPPRFLDGRGDVAAAFSLRRLRSAYAGPLVRVRRASDGAEADFGVGQRDVDWGTVLSFIGAGSASVPRWYDQSGNGRDFIQAAAADQPGLLLLANGRPGLVAVGDRMTTAAFALGQPISFLCVYRRVAVVQVDFQNLFSSSAADAVTFYRSNTPASGNSLFSSAAFLSNDSAQPTGSRGAVGGTFNGAASLMEVNAALVASFAGNPGATGLNGLTLFTNWSQSAGRNDSAELQELILFNTAHGAQQHRGDIAARRRAWTF